MTIDVIRLLKHTHTKILSWLVPLCSVVCQMHCASWCSVKFAVVLLLWCVHLVVRLWAWDIVGEYCFCHEPSRNAYMNPIIHVTESTEVQTSPMLSAWLCEYWGAEYKCLIAWGKVTQKKGRRCCHTIDSETVGDKQSVSSIWSSLCTPIAHEVSQPT